jgi:hypothetical protein
MEFSFMPLVEKAMSNSTADTAATVLCLPATLPLAVLCCCRVNPIFSHRESKENAQKVASEVLSDGFLKEPHPKLNALKTDAWNPCDQFALLASINDGYAMGAVKNKINLTVKHLLNCYDFNTIKSQDLTKEEIKLIGKTLRHAVFSELPSKEVFSEQLNTHDLDINTVQNDLLNGMLSQTLLDILEGDFIKNQFDEMAEIITAQRNSAQLMQANNLMLFSAGAALTQGNIQAVQEQMIADRTAKQQMPSTSFQ